MLRAGLVLGGLVAVIGFMQQRFSPTALPRAGGIMVLIAAICEWLMLSWRLSATRVAKDWKDVSTAAKRDLQREWKQLAFTAPLIHAELIAGWYLWVMGDLL